MVSPKFTFLLTVLLFTFTLTIYVATMALESVYLYIINPACTFPVVKHSSFCQALPRNDATPSHEQGLLCGSLPFLSSFGLCKGDSSASALHPPSNTSLLLTNQFSVYSSLLNGSSTTPAFGSKTRIFIMSLEDMTILLKGSTVRSKATLISHIKVVREASRESTRRLNKYTARLLTSINTILTLSDYTIGVAQSTAADSKAASAHIWTGDRHSKALLQTTYLHTLKSFETLNHELVHLNGEVYESLVTLDSYIEVLADLVYDEALVETRQEIREILGRFWNILGIYHSSISEARQQEALLEHVGVSTKVMKHFVLDVQMQLESLQDDTESLRAQAAEPLLIDGPIAVENVVYALKEGCSMLRDQLITVKGVAV